MESARSMPARLGLSRGESVASAPNAASTWNQIFSAAAISANAVKSSVAPTSTEPAVPVMRKGCLPALRSSAIADSRRRNIHAVIRADRDQAEILRAKTRHVHGAGDAAMRAGGGVGGKLFGTGAGSAASVAELSVTRAEQCHEIRHRRTGEQHAAGFGRHAHHLRGPGDYLPLYRNADMVAAAAIGVHRTPPEVPPAWRWDCRRRGPSP